MNEQELLDVSPETNDYSKRAVGASFTPTVDLRVQPCRLNYFTLLSRAAHAWDTPESAASPPGITAQPPFST